MQTHNLVRRTKNYKPAAVGRGGKRGKTSGRGTKGQNARSGRKKRPEMRDFIKRIPKLRGRGVAGLRTFQSKPLPLNLGTINSHFKAGEIVNPEILLKKGMISLVSGKIPAVKILAGGELTQKITVSGCKVSAEAKSKIEKLGGKVE